MSTSDETTGGHPTGPLSQDEVAKRAETRAKRATAVSCIASYLSKAKDLPSEFVDAIKLLVNLDNRRQPNSLYTRVIDFIMGKKVTDVDEVPPGKGNPVDDMTLFKAFRVATTDMQKVIYQGQDDGIWISAVKKGKDTLYTYYGEGAAAPEGYPGPNRKPRTKKEEETE